jgi:hypothetical protein
LTSTRDARRTICALSGLGGDQCYNGAVALTIEIVYETAAGLRHDYDTELRVGGLYARVAPPPGTPPLAEVALVLRVPGAAPIAAPARLTVAMADSLCVEILPDARPPLEAAVAAVCAGVAAVPGRVSVRILPGPPGTPEAPPADADGNAASPAGDAPADAPTGPEASARASATRAAERAERDRLPLVRRLELMSVTEKMQLAGHGERDARVLLARDRAAPVQCGLVRNPKLTLDEAQALARNPQLAGEAAEALAQHPSWGASGTIVLALVRNPRTPLSIAMALVARLAPADLRVVAKGLHVRTQIAQAARKRLFAT